MESNGLHTNGYTLARKVLFDQMGLKLTSKLDGVKGTLADELLRVHRNYQPALAKIPHGIIKGLAHITGGGLTENVPRVLPEAVAARIDSSRWEMPAIFRWLRKQGNIEEAEMHRTFNCGIGMVLIVSKAESKLAVQTLADNGVEAFEIGSIVQRPPGSHQTVVV
jgi:phosphoribosylformylglycinamidine cyclo-ligase